jgi:ribonucleoside-diphosphate reductase alpha chain
VFSFDYTRNIILPDGTRRAEQVSDPVYRRFRREFGEDAPLPPEFVDAGRLTPAEHLAMQAAAQVLIDSSISKTINCPEELSFEAFKDIYLEAYALGCKGCTTYRPNPVTGAVLETKPKPDARARAEDGVVYMTQPLNRPDDLPGRTYKLRWPDSPHAIYITLNDMVRDGRRRPFEVFINSKNMEHFAWTVALTRMISAVFRRGGDVSFVVEEMKAVFDPRGGQWLDGHYVPSLLAAIGEVIERHLIDIGFMPKPAGISAHAKEKAMGDSGVLPGACPKCGAEALIRAEGCDLCTACGYSKCG